jgi:hypothetical protein
MNESDSGAKGRKKTKNAKDLALTRIRFLKMKDHV